QPAEPATECWETATFNNTTCSWDVTGTQPAEPATECWETATFNNTTCSWDVTGTQPAEPATECWETATFNNTTCSWDVTGTQPAEPATECWETATFNNTTCSWDVTGTQPAEPSTECWETATFNNTTCSWEIINNGDTVNPVCNTQDITVELDAFGNAAITANQIDNGSSDNCAINSMTVIPNTFDSSDIGDNVVVFTVTDNSGNTSNCNATVTVVENTLGNTEFDYNGVSIQPNPFNSYVNIQLPIVSSNDEFKIILYDLNGRIVYNSIHSTLRGVIKVGNMDKLEQGSYLIKITNELNGKSVIKKLIKF
ncbi:T9SS type A sorting domain-containing protein, partial [Hanstruepera flava]|uniref:T9SS type A sorting domain-containing protein n=1 Tax=Hanstruepera flava TaxID=2930218 RepID=UPI0020284649